MIDHLGELRRIMNMGAGETFNPATDSLEAISNALGIGPSVGLSMFGICDPAMAASQTVIVTNNLGGLVDDIFNDEFYMQVILNRSVPGAAPEGEIRRITNFVAATQTFTTDAFSANVEANDLVLILHETLISIEITGRGTFTLSDLVLPEDNLRTEGGNYFRGCMLMPIEGAARFQPRLIVSYTGAGGIFALDPGNPFSVLPGLVDYIIIRNQTQFVPLADGTENRIPADVTGNKADTAAYAKTATASALRYLKGLLDAGIAVSGAVADAGPLVSDFDTNLTEATNDHYNGMLLMFINGPNAGQAHTIDDYIGATKNVSFHSNDWFTDVPVNGNTFVILPSPALRIMTGLGVVTASTYSHPNGVAEQDALIFAAAKQEINIRLDFSLLTQNTTIREKEQVDGANYQQISAKVWPTDFDTGTMVIDLHFVQANADYKITLQSAVAEGGAKNIPYRYEVRSLS